MNRDRLLRLRRQRYRKNRKEVIQKTGQYHKTHRKQQRAYGKKYRSKPTYKTFNRHRMQVWRRNNRARANQIARQSYYLRTYGISL